MPKTRLNKKHKAARLSNENPVVEAWLTEKPTMNEIEHVSHKYRFERLSDDLLRLNETISRETGAVIDAEPSELSEIATKLIQAEVAMEVQNKTGHMVAELKVI